MASISKVMKKLRRAELKGGLTNDEKYPPLLPPLVAFANLLVPARRDFGVGSSRCAPEQVAFWIMYAVTSHARSAPCRRGTDEWAAENIGALHRC